MQQATHFQLSPSRQSSYQPQPIPNLQDKVGTLCSQLQCQPPASRETLLQQLDKDKMMPSYVPRLRAVVESQTFKNILVDEMDMMLSRAATLIQANWRGYRLRQKLTSQMLAAKAIQEAWRRFSTRRLLRSVKAVEKKVSIDEMNIPYHHPQQVRFQHLEEGRYFPAPPIMVSKETQFPSADHLAVCAHELDLLQPPGTSQTGMQAPSALEASSIIFLPHQNVSTRLPCPVSLNAKCHPCLMTRTVRSPSLVHIDGDMTKTKQVTARTNKAGSPGPPPSRSYAQTLYGPLKTQTQAPVEAEALKAPPQADPAPVMTKTPVTTITMTKTPPQVYPAAAVTKTPLHSCLASMMNKGSTQPCPVPTVTIAKTPPQVYPAAPVAKTPLQSCLAAILNKIPTQPCPVPTIMMTKTQPQPYPAAPMTKTPVQMQATASMTNTASQTRPTAVMAKIPPQICLLTSIIKPPNQTCPVPVMAKTPPQTCPVPTMAKTSPQTCPVSTMAKTSPKTCPVPTVAKTLPQTCPVPTMAKTLFQTCQVPVMTKIPPQMCPVPMTAKVPPQTCPMSVMAKTPPQTRPVATMAKTPLQTCPTATIAKTPSQTLPGSSATKAPPQTRLAAMITKTPAQLRSVAAILKTLCLPPPAAGNLKASPPAAMAAGIPNTLSHICLNKPKTKAGVTVKQTAGMVKVSSHSHLTEGKVKYCSPRHLGAGAPKAPARPLLEAEKVKGFSRKQVKTETVSNTIVAMEVPKVAEEKSEGSSQAHPRMGVAKVQPQGCVTVEEAAVVLPQAQVATYPAKTLPQAQMTTCSTTTSPQGHLLTELTTALPQAHLSTCLSKASSQTHPPAKLTKAPSLAHLGTCLTKTQSQAHLATGAIKVQSQSYLPTGLTKAQSQAHLVTETAKCLYAAHQAAELSSKTQSQPLLAGYKASTQPCQHVSSLGTFSRAKPEDRLTQLPATSYGQGKATQGPRQGASEPQSMLVPLLASTGHPTCNVESWGDSGATRTQPSTTSPAAPCQEELAASQLTSLCAELAAVLGSQEDLRTQLAKALSQGEVKAALNQALSKEVLGATMAKARPQGMLGTALVKALSWGELGTALSRVLSRGELRAELAKAMQGKLVDILSKALTEEERAALSQTLCQGELGAVLSQSLSQAALRTGLALPKVAAVKTAGSGMMMAPAPVEADYRGSPSAAWGPTLGPVRPQPSKVRVPRDGSWEGFITDWPTGLLEEMGDGAMVRGSPCLSIVPVGASLTGRVSTTILQYPLITALDPNLSWEMEPLRDSSLNLFLSPKVSEENVYLHPGANELASDLNPVASYAGPDLPEPHPLQLPHHLWQPLVANGVAPSTSRPSVASGTAPSSHKPHVTSRVAPRLSASSGEGRVAPGKLSGTAGGGRATHSHHCVTTFGGSTCWCQPSEVSKGPPGVYRPSAAKGLQQPSMVPEKTMQKTQSPNHKQVSMGTSEMINKVTSCLPWDTTVSKISLTQPQTSKACERTPGLLPGSMAPGHPWALESQGDPSLWKASPVSQLTLTHPRTVISRQEKNQTQGTISGASYPQELVTGHILSELVTHLPQNSDNDLAQSVSQGSTDCGLNANNSQSSSCSCSSLSLSSTSVASLTTVDLVERESGEASMGGGLLSGETTGRSQRPGDLEETERVGHGHMTSNPCHPPSSASEQIPILHHSAVSSHVTLSVHWSSSGQDERDISSSQSSMGSLRQKPNRTRLKRSLSLGSGVPPLYQQPSVTSKLTPSPSQTSVAYKVTLSLGQPSKASGVAHSLAPSSMTCRVAPSLAQPSMTSGVTPSLAHSTMGNSVAPSLGQPSVMNGTGCALSQPVCAPGEGPDLSSRVNAVAPCLRHPSFLTEVTLNTLHPSGVSGIGLELSQPSVTTGVDPCQGPLMGHGAASDLQAPELSKVSSGFNQPLGVGGRCPRTTEHSAVTVLAPDLDQASVTSGEASCLGQGTRISQGILFGGMATSTSQGTVAAGILPNVSWRTLAASKFLSMSQGPMSPGVIRSMCQRSVATAVGPRQSQVGSGMAPMASQASVTGAPLVHEQAPGVGPGFSPALVVNRLGLSPSKFPLDNVGLDVSQVNADLPVPMDNQCSPMSTVTTSSYQQSNSFSQEPVMGMASLPGPGSVANRMTTATALGTVASDMAPSLSQRSVIRSVGQSLPPESVISGMAPSLALGYMVNCVSQTLPPGSMISGMGQGLPPGSVISGMSQGLPPGSVISGMGQGLPPGFVISGMGQGLPPGSVISGMSQGLPPGSMIGEMGQGLPPGSVIGDMVQGLPTGSVINSMGQSFPTGSAISGLGQSHRPESMISGTGQSHPPGSVIGGMGQSLPTGSMISGTGQSHPPGSVIGGMGQSLPTGSMISGTGQSHPPGSAIGGMGQNLPTGSMISGMGQGLPPGSVIGGMGQGLPPGSVIGGMGQRLPPGSVIGGMGQGLPPGSVIGGMGQSLPPGSVISAMVQCLPPGSVISGVGQVLLPDPVACVVAHSLPPGFVVSGVAQSFTPGFMASGISRTLPPGSVVSGVGPSVSSVASKVVPAFMGPELNQGLVLGSTASAAGPPSTAGSVAHSLPQGSMLIGLTPRPYHGALSGEGSTSPFQASHATGKAQVHSNALGANGRARGVNQVPTVLQRASQLSHTLSTMAFETKDGQAVMKPEGLDKALSQGSRSSRESMVLEATPWISKNPLASDSDFGHKVLAEDRTIAKGQRLPLEGVAPSQAKSMISGMAPVPPSVAKHTKASNVTLTPQQRSTTSKGTPSSHFVAAREIPSVQMGSVKGTGAPLANQVSMVHLVPQSSLATHTLQSPSATHMPQRHSHETMASTVISGSPWLPRGSSVSGMGTTSTSQRSGATSVASHVLPYPSKITKAASHGLQVEAVPSGLQKPASGNLAQSSHHQPLGPRKSYTSMHGSFVARTLDGSVAKTEPSQQVGEPASKSAQEGPKGSADALPAVTPIIHTGDLGHDMAIPRLHHRVRRVSLGYESSPNGSRRSLINWESRQGPQDFHSAVTPVDSHRVPLTPTILQGPVDAGVAGGKAWNSAVPSVVAGPVSSAAAPGGAWEPPARAVPWDAVGSKAAVDPSQSGKLVASMQVVEKIIVQAVVTIQACARGYLVRRTIKVWHQWAIIIQAAWRGHCVRRDLAQLCRASTIIQATWRGYRVRRSRTQQTPPCTWAKVGGRAKSTSDHRCFQSCQPHVCTLCRSLSAGVGSPPSVVMLVGSSPRTCHMCGHTLPTRVVQGLGRGTMCQAGNPWGYDNQLTHQSPQQLHGLNKAATVIQASWRGFVVRRRLRQQQLAAKMLQANWRGHYTRNSLTTDALLGSAEWDHPQNMQWPGV